MIVGCKVSMESVKYKVTWKTFLLPLVGLVAFFLYILIFNVDLFEIASKIQRANPYPYLLATIATLLDTLFFALAWHSLLTFLSVQISRVRLYIFVWVGIFVDTLIPAESVSGEISRIYLVNKQESGTAGKATASIVVQRLIGMGISIGTLITGAALLLIESQIRGIILILVLFLIAVILLFLVLVLLLCVKERWTMRIVEGIFKLAEKISRGRWKLSKVREEAIETAKAFHSAVKEYLHAPKTMLAAIVFSLTSWMLALLVLYLTFVAIGYPQISWIAILVVSAIFAAVKSIPIGVPFEVGLPEITMTSLLILFDVPGDISATATILMRLLTLWLRFVIGFAAQQWVGLKAITTDNTAKPHITPAS
jgi:uncharacterized protein (TIRG00374 family)